MLSIASLLSGGDAEDIARRIIDSRLRDDGFSPGETVYWTAKKIEYPSGDVVVKGLRGVITGSSDSADIEVKFDGHQRKTDVHIKDVSKKDPMGGYKAGDVVYYVGESQTFGSGDSLRAGMRGTISGPSESSDLLIQFDGHKLKTNLAKSKVSKEPSASCASSQAIRVGDSVRVKAEVKEPMHNWGQVRPGHVGKVTSIDGAACRIDFPSQRNWRGVLREMELVRDVTVGSSVRVATWVERPKHNWGSVKPGDIGVITRIENEDCWVDFRAQKGWRGCVSEMEVVQEERGGQLQVGDRVRVKPGVSEPKYNWGKVKRGDVGVLKSLNVADDDCRVDFPAQANWRGVLSEMEAVKDAAIKVGDRVRVKPQVATPKHNWGSVKHGHVGVVVSLDAAAGDCRVDFPTQKNWRGALSEMELAKDVSIKVGDSVRVKAEVSMPKHDWGKIKHGDVGVVKSINPAEGDCRVDFPSQPGWHGLLSEMEPAAGSSGPQESRIKVGDLVKVKVAAPKHQWGKVKAGDVGAVKSLDAASDDCRVDFQAQPNWHGVLSEMELVEEGYRPGETVYYIGEYFKYDGGDVVKPGLRGTVRPGGEGQKVKVMFEAHERLTNVTCWQISRTPPEVVSGFRPGDTVYYTGQRQTYPGGDTVSKGLKGVVMSVKDDGGVKVQFDGHKLVTNLLPDQVSDKVLKRLPMHEHHIQETDRSGGWFCDGCGEQGTGRRFRCTSGCDFDLCVRCFSDPQRSYLPEDTVYFVGQKRDGSGSDVLTRGLRGSVVDLAEGAKVRVQFDGHRNASLVKHSEISRQDPMRGYRTGDAVFYTGPRKAYPSGDVLEEGHKGTVVSLGDRNELLCVKFEGHRNQTDVLFDKLSREEPARVERNPPRPVEDMGGYAKGDKVYYVGGAFPALRGKEVEVLGPKDGGLSLKAGAERFTAPFSDVSREPTAPGLLEDPMGGYNGGEMVYYIGADETLKGKAGIVVAGGAVATPGSRALMVMFVGRTEPMKTALRDISRQADRSRCFAFVDASGRAVELVLGDGDALSYYVNGRQLVTGLTSVTASGLAVTVTGTAAGDGGDTQSATLPSGQEPLVQELLLLCRRSPSCEVSAGVAEAGNPEEEEIQRGNSSASLGSALSRDDRLEFEKLREQIAVQAPLVQEIEKAVLHQNVEECKRVLNKVSEKGLLVESEWLPEIGGFLSVEKLKRTVSELQNPNRQVGGLGDSRLAKALDILGEDAILELFAATASHRYEVVRVELIRNRTLVDASSAFMDIADRRRGGITAARFNLTLPPGLDQADKVDKGNLIQFLKDRFRTSEWAPANDGRTMLANILPLWHGCGEEAANSIAKTGFAALADPADVDPGFFGNGRYTAIQAELACRYATYYPEPKGRTACGNFVAVMALGVTGSTYPITPGAEDFYQESPLPDHVRHPCKYYGGSKRRGCDAHIIAIKADMETCCKPDEAEFHEFVCFQDAQLLPVAKVYFKEM